MSEGLCIDGRTVGPGRRTFVIAELGVNHDGCVRRAVELVSTAAASGADAVKLQLFRADRLLHPSASFAAYQRDRTDAPDPIEMLRRYELTDEEAAEVVAAARELNIVPLATPFSPEDVDLVEGLALPAVKIASPDLVNRPLLARVARLGRPVLLSTGGATMEEVQRSVQWLSAWGVSFALLHCVSSYPTPPEMAHLGWIGELAARFHVPVGYSDHTTLTAAGALAVAFGAALVEKHVTYDRSAPGPDHAASSDPQQFGRYVKLIREADTLRGMPRKRVLDVERDVRAVSRQSLVLRRALRAGEAVGACDLTAQRPGKGISPAMIEDIAGRRALRALPAGTMLQWDMLDESNPAETPYVEAPFSHAA
jgi:N-acetylneuraminate synthase/N,N'-diacetyllegionaminate synthase